MRPGRVVITSTAIGKKERFFKIVRDEKNGLSNCDRIPAAEIPAQHPS